MFTTLEDLYAEVEINSAWETNRDTINISTKGSESYFESKKFRLVGWRIDAQNYTIR
jgi:hypothetical protein